MIKYLHSVITNGEQDNDTSNTVNNDRQQHAMAQQQVRGDGGTGFLDDYNDNNPSSNDALEVMELQPVTVRLGNSGIGDEEIHALVAVLSSKDRADLLDLRGNNIGDVGARGLATLLRSSNVLTEVDVRNNNIGPTGKF